MRQVVRHVGEQRPAGPDPPGRVDRLLDGEVRPVRLVAQRVEHQHVEVFQQRPRGVGNRVAVGQVGERPDAEPEHRQRPVQQRDRDDRRAAEREGAGQLVQVEPRQASARRGGRVEDVVERLPHPGQGARGAVAGYRAPLAEVVDPHVVEPEHVVGVGVREEDGVDARKLETERLRAQVRRRVDQHGGAVVEGERQRRAPTLVARIVRAAGRAAAGDHGHAGRRSGSEEGDAHVRTHPPRAGRTARRAPAARRGSAAAAR